MRTFFQDILYPASDDEFSKLIDTSLEALDAKVILLPHASASVVAPFYSSALKNLSGKKIVFLAPMHNERMQDHPDASLLTVSPDSCASVKVESAPGIAIEDSILEEEYTLELLVAFLSHLTENTTVYPIFTSLENRKEIKALERYLSSFRDAVVIISGNFSAGGSNAEALRSAELLYRLLKEDQSLLDEGNKGHLTGCCWALLEATRSFGGDFTIIASRCGEKVSASLEEGDGKFYQVYGARIQK